MKNKISSIITAIVLITISSCTDFLDTKPLDKMVFEDYWKTQGDVESTVLACYRAMEEDGYMERIILGGELRSDNVIVDVSKLKTPVDVAHINDMTIKSTNGILTWKDFYRVINYCNTVLEFAPDIVDIDPTYTQGFMRAHLAEAYTIRALTYFYLVRLYRDVPYIDFPYKEDSQEFVIPQTSGDEILRLLTEQLETFAEKYALISWGTTSGWQQKGRVTKNLVRALLADIYLWLGEYDKCIAACERIEPFILGENEIINWDLATGAELRLISNKTYDLHAFESMFLSANSMESIFELQFAVGGKTNTKLASLYYGSTESIGHLAATLFSGYVLGTDGTSPLFNDKDIRGKTSFEPQSKTGSSAQGFSEIIKYFRVIRVVDGNITFSNSRNVDLSPPNWIFYRVADVYLMKAEALTERNQADDLKTALEMVNLTYQRSCPDASPLLEENYDTQDLMRKLVFDERQREFLFEGKRWFDMLRMARKEDMKNGVDSHPEMLNYVTRKYTYNGDVIRSKLVHTDALYLPIHADELISNTALKQNPYYQLGK